MKLKINIKAIYQYIVIYFMLLTNASNFYEYDIYPNQNLQYFIIIILFAILIVRYKNISKNTMFFCLIMLLFITFVRVFIGGIGLVVWNEIAIKVLSTILAISIDFKEFFNRFIKTVIFLVCISLFFWVMKLAGLNLAKILFSSFNTRYNNVTYDLNGYKSIVNLAGYGKFFYTYQSSYDNKNIGIFLEPGVYQMVLNSALFVLLNMGEYINITIRKSRIYFFLLIIGVISTQSTTGYIGLFTILICTLFKRNSHKLATGQFNWKKTAIKIIFIGSFLLLVDYLIRGNDSMIYSAIISKLFTDNYKFSLVAEQSTGKYRIAAIIMAITAMISFPFGLGADGWIQFCQNTELAVAGGWPFKFGAMVGVIPFLYLLYWIFSPLKILRKDKITIVLFVFLYFNTSLAQSSAVYPCLIMIPMYLRIVYKYTKLKNRSI